jgi:hypothetical protein
MKYIRIRRESLEPDGILIRDRMRAEINEDAVSRLMASIKEIGLQTPPTVRWMGDEPVLIAGRHRVEACKRLGIPLIECIVHEGDERTSRMWEIAENLHRADLTALERDGHAYVLRDASGRYTPDGWARRAVQLFRDLRADRIVAEANFGGAMVEATIRAIDQTVPVKMVTASRGKQVRAEPIVALYEQRRVHHVGGFPELEDQLCGWDPMEGGPSPDRLDALVWALTEITGGHAPMRISPEALAASRVVLRPPGLSAMNFRH